MPQYIALQKCNNVNGDNMYIHIHR